MHRVLVRNNWRIGVWRLLPDHFPLTVKPLPLSLYDVVGGFIFLQMGKGMSQM